VLKVIKTEKNQLKLLM